MIKRLKVSSHSPRLHYRATKFPSYFSHPWLLLRNETGFYDSSQFPSVAIVGTRRPSAYGIRMTKEIVKKLASVSSQIQINSGGALGIDGHAHQAALDNYLRTHAWLVGPVAQPSPRYHSNLFDRILKSQGGALWVPEVLEPSLKRDIAKYFWVLRNYWLVAASDAVVVVEASASSGTWWTVEAAQELGVPVFALPGPVDTPQSKGTNAMISDGYASSLNHFEVLTNCLLVDFVKDSYNFSIEGSNWEAELSNTSCVANHTVDSKKIEF